MVKWYNESLPRISREFDSPWPHIGENRKSPSGMRGIFCLESNLRCFRLQCEPETSFVSFKETKGSRPGRKFLLELERSEQL